MELMKVFILFEKGAKSEPKGTKGSQRETKGAKSEPKGSQGEPKVSHLDAQGRQKWAKGRPECIEKSSCGKGREKRKTMRTIMSHPSIDSYHLENFRKAENTKLRKYEKKRNKSAIRPLIRIIWALEGREKGRHPARRDGPFLGAVLYQTSMKTSMRKSMPNNLWKSKKNDAKTDLHFDSFRNYFSWKFEFSEKGPCKKIIRILQ